MHQIWWWWKWLKFLKHSKIQTSTSKLSQLTANSLCWSLNNNLIYRKTKLPIWKNKRTKQESNNSLSLSICRHPAFKKLLLLRVKFNRSVLQCCRRVKKSLLWAMLSSFEWHLVCHTARSCSSVFQFQLISRKIQVLMQSVSTV